MLEFRVLGPFEVLRDGELLRIVGERERSLLALLVMNASEVVSTDQLIDRLWGDELPANPGNALQAVVSRVRRTLAEEGAVVTRKPGYALEVDAESIDAVRFERTIARGARLATEDPSLASDLLATALRLWRGEPYADFAYVDLVEHERARLQELYVAGLEEKIAVDLTLGRAIEALAEAERLVARYPLRERLRGQLMLALYRLGRQADAIAAYQETRRVLDEELGLYPGPELEDLYRRILRQDPSLQAPSGDEVAGARTNIPARVTTFIGREAEIQQVATLTRDHRLVTIVGPGGAGKTSLAVEVARRETDAYDHGVWLVELAPVGEADLVVPAISDALGLVDEVSGPRQTQPPLSRLNGFLGSKHLLLILDNCEHVVQRVAEVAEGLVRMCPGVKILATSREVLATSAEYVWTIPPLSVPDPGVATGALGSFDAVRLFNHRAESAGAPVAGEEAVQAAAEICRRLDGLPLAIELAAARARSFPLQEITRRLEDRFAVLAAGGRTAAPRHRTLKAAIDWSYELLAAPERALFHRLGVFSGGWTLEAAEQVCGDGEIGDVLDVQARLVDQSLVMADGDRFSMLETILAYARDRLAEGGEGAMIRERHARYFRVLAESIEPELRGVHQRAALERLRAEEHNLRAALRWGRDRAGEDPEVGLGIAAALGWYWYVGRQAEGRTELVEMLAAASGASARTRARALQALSLTLRPAGCIVHPSDEAAQAAQASRSLFESVGDDAGSAMSQLLFAVEGVAGGDLPAFLGMVDAARDELRAQGDAWGLALADFIEMEIRLYHDSLDRALALGEQASHRFDLLGDDWGRSAVRLHLGFGLRLAGRTDEASRILDEAVAISRETGLHNNLARSLVELGEVSVYLGDLEEAERWFQACDAIVENLADLAMEALVASGRGDAARYRGDPSGAIGHYERALSLYRRSGVARGVARTLTALAAAELDLDMPDPAEDRLGEAGRLVAEAADPALLASVKEQLARLLSRRGREEEARALVDEANELRLRFRRPGGALPKRDVSEVTSGDI